MQLPIAELTYDELHGPLRADEGALAERAVATDAIRPTHAHTHTDRTRTSTGTQKHAISINTETPRRVDGLASFIRIVACPRVTLF